MTSAANIIRLVITWVAVVLTALVVVYFLATPDYFSSLGVIILIFGVSVLPIFLRWHQPLLIGGWNLFIVLTFLPGQPRLAILLTAISVVCSVLALTVDRKAGFQNDMSLTLPLLALVAVLLITSKIRGGIGLSSLGGGNSGGKHIVWIIFGVAAYFAFSAKKLPVRWRSPVLIGYFLGGLTAVVPNIAYSAGPAFYWLFIFFPVDAAIYQASADMYTNGIARFTGIGSAALAIYFFSLARFGWRGHLEGSHPIRGFVLLLAFSISLLGGFRSSFTLCLMVSCFLFFLEGLHKTKWLAIFGFGGAFVLAALVFFAGSLPEGMQRSLSVLPFVQVDASVRSDAEGSSDWRLRMWQLIWPQVPQYFWLGKGHSIDQTDLYLSGLARERGFGTDSELAMISGDYHSGPLSLIIPLGIFGVLAFLAFAFGAFRMMIHNYRHGLSELRAINAFLLAYFAALFVSFWTIFGGFSTDIATFASLAGLSMALNGVPSYRSKSPGLRDSDDKTQRPSREPSVPRHVPDEALPQSIQ